MGYVNHLKPYQRPRKKKLAYRELERKLDRIFSEYVRLKTVDDRGYCQCITCGNFYHWKNIHCGHYISRSVKATRFNEINCNPQCVRCNSFRQGEHHIYRNRLVKMYGKDEVEKLEQIAQLGGSYDLFLLQEKITEYKEKVKQLKRRKSYKQRNKDIY
jgi:hypothetical protein